jgi:hypothetical protein
MQSQIQSIMLSKDTISSLNNILNTNPQINNFTRENRTDSLQILIKNMKMVYKMMDTSKINNSNFTSIFDQFKKHCVQQTTNEIANLLHQNTSNTKFNRDFNSNPNTGNKMLDRPTSTKVYNNDNMSNMDTLFKPLINDNSFNNFNSKQDNNIESKISDIQKMRQTEIGVNKRPPTPDFLKSKQTNPQKTNDNNNNNIYNNNNINNNDLGFMNLNNNNINNNNNNDLGFMNLNNNDENIYSLDNIDKPIINGTIEEDTSSFEDRLKRLQSDRGRMSMPIQQNGNVDFTSENFVVDNINPDSFNNQFNNNTFNNNQSNNQLNNQPINNNQQNNNQLYNQLNNNQLHNNQLHNNQLHNNQLNNNQLNNKLNNSVNNSNSNNSLISLDIDEQGIKFQIPDRMTQSSYEQQNSKNLVPDRMTHSSYEQQNSNEESKLKILIEQKKNKDIYIQKIEEMVDTLTKDNINFKNTINNLKMEKYELEMRNVENSNIISTFNKLELSNNIKYTQLELTNKNTSYLWNFNKTIVDVVGIKLLSYSLPLPRYNIDNNNNILYINNYKLEIPKGNYNINELLLYINNNNNDIRIILNTEQHIKILSNLDNPFTLETSYLLKYNLGFELDRYENEFEIISDYTWDLRLNSKAYLYFNNISDDMPFAILNYNGTSQGEFKFEDKFNLNKIEIVIKDQNNNIIDFDNLTYYISILVSYN